MVRFLVTMAWGQLLALSRYVGHSHSGDDVRCSWLHRFWCLLEAGVVQWSLATSSTAQVHSLKGVLPDCHSCLHLGLQVVQTEHLVHSHNDPVAHILNSQTFQYHAIDVVTPSVCSSLQIFFCSQAYYGSPQ